MARSKRSDQLLFRLGGEEFSLKFASLRKLHGDCDHTLHEIRLTRNRRDPRCELETVIHELLHGLDPKWREWWVGRSAEEIADVLWRLGYRKSKDEAEIQ